MNVLIPQNFPGKFYYPPCKCELMNQIRYYNPKTKEFYYHKAHTATPPNPQATGQGSYLGGEPEFYPVPANSAPNQDGSHSGQYLPSPSLTLPYPYMPASQYYPPFDRHQMVSTYSVYLIMSIKQYHSLSISFTFVSFTGPPQWSTARSIHAKSYASNL